MPGSKRPITDIHLDTLSRSSEPGIFPVVNCASSVGREMRQPLSIHHSFEDFGGAVSKQVGTIDQHDAGASLASSENILCTLLDERQNSFGTRFSRRIRVDQDFVRASQTLTLRQRKYFELTQIDWLDFHLDFPKRGSRSLTLPFCLRFDCLAEFDSQTETRK